MAEGKKSVLVYADWGEKFEAVSNEEAGRLIKHFFRFVNDENPTGDRLTELLFIDMKQSLKRDLVKWENTKKSRSEAGKASANARKSKVEQQKPTKTTNVDFVEQTSTKSTVSVSVSDSVSSNEDEKESTVVVSKKHDDDGSDFSEKAKAKHKGYAMQAAKDETWVESVCIKKLAKPEEIPKLLSDFNIFLTQQGKTKPNIQEYKSHFVNWLVKRPTTFQTTETKTLKRSRF